MPVVEAIPVEFVPEADGQCSATVQLLCAASPLKLSRAHAVRLLPGRRPRYGASPPRLGSHD